MSSATTNRPPPHQVNRHDDLDNYDVGDLSEDPFASPSPPSKKRKEPDQSGLGIDEEVSVQKRARVPNVKLDEERLLGPSGIPKLRTRARHLKIKGKGHEFSDAGRLLSFYQLWLDDLFPKARFLDALAMVEKAGHKKTLITRRNEWINEGKPRTADDYAKELEEAEGGDDEATATASAEGRAQQSQQAGRPATPDGGDVPDDDDLYDATPRNTRRTVPIMPNRNDEPDPDDLDALMAEAEGQDTSNQQQQKQTSRPVPPPPQRSGDDEDDLDALIAEAEGHDNANKQKGPSSTSAGQDASRTVDADFADDEAALQEMEGMW